MTDGKGTGGDTMTAGCTSSACLVSGCWSFAYRPFHPPNCSLYTADKSKSDNKIECGYYRRSRW